MLAPLKQDATPALDEERKKLTPQKIQAAANLKRVWDQKRKQAELNGHRLTQKDIMKKWGWSQPMVSHYLNAITPLGVEAIMKWSLSLEVPPTKIDPAFEYSSVAPGDLPPEAIELAVHWTALPDSNPIKKISRDLILSGRAEG